MFYAYIFFAYAFVCGVYGICVCMSTHVWMHMDACRGQRLMPGIFSSCSPLHLMWQGLLLNPKFNDSASLASLLATGSQSVFTSQVLALQAGCHAQLAFHLGSAQTLFLMLMWHALPWAIPPAPMLCLVFLLTLKVNTTVHWVDHLFLPIFRY